VLLARAVSLPVQSRVGVGGDMEDGGEPGSLYDPQDPGGRVVKGQVPAPRLGELRNLSEYREAACINEGQVLHVKGDVGAPVPQAASDERRRAQIDRVNNQQFF
jgi:hypothetical protein